MKFICSLLLFICVSLPAQMQPWLTRSYDNARSNWNSNETTLTQASIMTKGVSLVTKIPVCCDARGMEAQPLIVPGTLTTKGGVDLMLLPSMSNHIRAVDAHTGVSIWERDLGTAVKGGPSIDMHVINDHWGCLSTGVVDISTRRLYQVCWVSVDNSGNPTTAVYFMYIINLYDGSDAVAPVALQTTGMWKQRSSLVLTNINGKKTIFFAHGSVFETSTGYTGGITAFDVATNTYTTLPMTSGIWMAGQGLISDSQGYLYAITGNGDFDPSKGWFGESFVKIKYTGTTMSIVDQWSPWTDDARAGMALPADKLSGSSLPTEESKPVGGKMSMSLKDAKLTASFNDQGNPVVLVYPAPMAEGAWADEDWGSAGPACILAINICIAAGKDGIGYPISMTNLGGTTVQTVGTTLNYGKLAAPCVWLTMSPGNVNCAPTNPTTLNFFPAGDSAHLHMTPVQFYDPILKSWTIFVWGENSQLHKWAVNNTGKLTYVAQSNEFASADVRGIPPGGMPGGFCSGSSNGNDPNSAILVCSVPYGDANARIVNGRLLIYDPVHLAVDGSLKVLWDSQQWGISYIFNKFMPPVIDGDEIVLPDYSGSVLIFK
jgi:hypothetical protein